MSLPQNTVSSVTLKSPLLYPDNVIRNGELEDFEMGGIALQDPSQGLQVQGWRGAIDPITLQATLNVINSPAPPIVIFTETRPDPVEFTVSFDSNMRYFAAVRWADGLMRFRWYDTALPGYTITEYTDIDSMMLALDDKRETASGTRDVLLTYIKDNKLYYRQQRDRFLIERLLDPAIRDNLRITQFGMGVNLRLQWRLEYRRAL